jgi:hypothetical protein
MSVFTRHELTCPPASSAIEPAGLTRAYGEVAVACGVEFTGARPAGVRL